MIDWIHDALRAWGRAKWRLISKDDGYPESIFGRIMEYGPSAGDHTRLEHFREGMTGEALAASLAIFRAIHARRLTDRQYETLFAHYAYRGKPPEEKARLLGYSDKSPYYRCINRAQAVLVDFFESDATE